MCYYWCEIINGIPITVCEESGSIFRIALGKREELSGERAKTCLIEECMTQLREYFEGIRKEFNIPISLKGTEFQVRVWKALMEIPYGKTISYGEIAGKIGSPKGARAVGGANNKNPIGIIVPCHRVIGARGELVGYGAGLDMKEYLLRLERENL